MIEWLLRLNIKAPLLMRSLGGSLAADRPNGIGGGGFPSAVSAAGLSLFPVGVCVGGLVAWSEEECGRELQQMARVPQQGAGLIFPSFAS